jgi:hypothetical protein
MGVAALIVAPHRARVRLLIEFPHQLGYFDRPRSVGDDRVPSPTQTTTLKCTLTALGKAAFQIATNLLLVMSTPGEVAGVHVQADPARPDINRASIRNRWLAIRCRRWVAG